MTDPAYNIDPSDNAAPQLNPDQAIAFLRALTGNTGMFKVGGDSDPNTKASQSTATPRKLPLLWFKDVQPALDANDFVKGFLMTTTLSVVYGDSNTGKTFFALDLALHVAIGRDWRGRTVQQGGVVYCALEGSYGIRNRLPPSRCAMATKQSPHRSRSLRHR